MGLLNRLCAPVAAFAFIAGGAHASEDGISQFTLENGMDVLVIEDHRSPAVVHMVWYRVGAADEPLGTSGIAHYLEHLMFKGTENMAAGEFSEVVRANGGSDNAFTSWDYTGYFQRVAADLLPQMMEMEADRMTGLILTDDVALPERSVILEERSQRVDSDPGAQFREQALAIQYLNHPYGRPIIGWRHEMEELSTDDALEFYREYYAPNNAILIVAGDVTEAEVRSLAEEYYAPIPANPELKRRERVAEPPQTAARRVVFEDQRVAQPYVARSYLAPERNPGDQDRAAALTLLSALLGDGPDGFLSRRLEFDAKTALYTGVWYGGTSLDPTTFNITVVPAEGVSLEDGEAALDAALAEFMEGGIDMEKLDRLKRQYAAQSIYEMDSTQGRARKYGVALTSGLTVEDVQAWPEVLQSVTEDDILAAAREVLVPQTSVTGWLRAPQAVASEVIQ
ncbi:M16 family metallopeptidase [Meridianimarinicoccus aquatilis]|uniref:Insulinase family protein n=1 Tax=Meridianimarinicoccus aquatilis TaxID=2552766 RepID=A0A4R6ARR2_9RHOB|nr:pitrilysin family protein [Fluviibacterium aquatile]TDL85318.1 insulinase family protein [Fluviibacterium aquatile]